MKEMAKHVPDAGSYAPVTVLVDERTDGVRPDAFQRKDWNGAHICGLRPKRQLHKSRKLKHCCCNRNWNIRRQMTN
jgi:hypothetical protein